MLRNPQRFPKVDSGVIASIIASRLITRRYELRLAVDSEAARSGSEPAKRVRYRYRYW